MSHYQLAYELVRHSNFKLLKIFNDDVIWLMNDSYVINVLVPEEYLHDNQLFNHIHHQFHAVVTTQQLKSKKVKVIQIGQQNIRETYKIENNKYQYIKTNTPQNIIHSPFFKMDITHKKAKSNDFYKQKLANKHPFEQYLMKFTPMTLLLVMLNTVVFLSSYILIHLFNNGIILNLLAAAKYEILNGEVHRLISSSFLHVSLEHFLFNVFSLYILGKFIENIYGKFYLVLSYIITGVLSSLFSIIFISDSIMLGASGAIYGLLGMLLVHLFLEGKVNTKLIIQITVLVIVISFLSNFFSNINHYAHFSGLFYGVLLGILYYYKKIDKTYVYITLIIFGLSLLFIFFFVENEQSEPVANLQAHEEYLHGNYNQSLAYVNEVFKRGNETPFSHYLLSLLHEEAGNEEEANRHLNIAFENGTTNEELITQKALHLRKNGDYDSLRELLEPFKNGKANKKVLKLMVEEYYGTE